MDDGKKCQSAAKDAAGEEVLGCTMGSIGSLGDLKPGTVITEEGIATLFNRHVTSVKRAVQRGELPPPCKLFGGNVWTARSIIRHIERRLAEEASEAELLAKRVTRISP